MVTLAKRVQMQATPVDSLAALDMSMSVGDTWSAMLRRNDLTALWIVFGLTGPTN
jgi:hypothetical protein